jgi:pseudouridine synthase
MMSETMRIQRALARAGIASRRKAEALIVAGRVRVNGDLAHTGQVVDPARDAILVDGKPLEGPRAAEWIMLNKPSGVMTTRSDPDGRRTVFELVPDVPGLTYVGRLDYLTEGLLLLTTDGAAAHRLSHPSSEVERTYVATVLGKGDEAARVAREGVTLEDGPVKPKRVEARKLGRDRWEFEVTITEGRKREVRRLCSALGLGVERLVRTRFGPVRLGDLPTGETRKLTPRERSALTAVGV